MLSIYELFLSMKVFDVGKSFFSMWNMINVILFIHFDITMDTYSNMVLVIVLFNIVINLVNKLKYISITQKLIIILKEIIKDLS